MGSTFLRMRLSRLILLLLVTSLAISFAHAATDSADAAHIHVQLVVPGQSLQPGAANHAGLYFKLEPGWHIYWKNAGDSGEPPHLKWTLPDGITAGDLQFPAPRRLPLGPLMDFGYENEVLFPFSLNVASAAKRGPAILHAKADWLVCREVCIPGKAELELKREVAGPGMPVSFAEPDASLYQRWSNSLPQPLPSSDKAVIQPTPTGFRLGITTGQRETQAAFRTSSTIPPRRRPRRQPAASSSTSKRTQTSPRIPPSSTASSNSPAAAPTRSPRFPASSPRLRRPSSGPLSSASSAWHSLADSSSTSCPASFRCCSSRAWRW